MSKPLTNLRAWLRAPPQPDQFRVRTEDDETRTIELSPNARNRWKSAEEAVRACRAVVVECLDKKGSILRSHELELEDDGDGEHGAKDPLAVYRKARIGDEKDRAADRRELAMMLDRYGDRLNEAFERGAQAAGVSQDNLVGLVETLTGHLGAAITNLHNVSVNFANLIQLAAGEVEGGGGQNAELLAKVIGLAMSQGQGGAAASSNGKPKGKA